LGLVKQRSLSSVSWSSLDLVVCVLRSLGKERNEEVSPISHGFGNTSETINLVERVKGDGTFSPLLESKLIACAVAFHKISFNAPVVSTDILVNCS
jgi:hypothetical protein